MPTLIITVSYDGSDYCGWQWQANGPSIQAVLERAIAKITGQRIRVTGSGRTDAGVHAFGQVASFTTESPVSAERWKRALNGQLPQDIRVVQVREAIQPFDPIRDAKAKRYRYVLDDGATQNVFNSRYAWYVRKPLDVVKMQDAGRCLIGEHDFCSFQAAGSPRATTIRKVHEICVKRSLNDPELVHVEIEANGFLYRMVRNIVGVLVDVGHGELEVHRVVEILEARDRKRSSRTAPSHGLFLLRVDY